ncbi:MAG: hypothetical protein P4L96_13640 [Rhodoferax sp.]|nr:hypothetical protein [Rhodoferax sp.]
MANGRNRGKGDSGRDSGGFVALPWTVLDCPAYATLSHPARALLLEVARQYHRDDNGRMLLSTAYLKPRGWLSAGAIQKAKQELIEAGFIHQMVQGLRPNKASWYACTWRALDKLPGFDAGAAETFQRGAYRFTAAKPKRPPPKCKNPKKNANLIPPHGIESPSIVPPHGIGEVPPIPPHGTIKATFGPLSIPPHGNPLEKPSAVVRSPAIPDSLSPETKAAFLGKTQKRPSARAVQTTH